MLITTLLSTIRRMVYTDLDGKVLASITRAGDARGGACRLQGQIPTTPHYVQTHYFDGRVENSLALPKAESAIRNPQSAIFQTSGASPKARS